MKMSFYSPGKKQSRFAQFALILALMVAFVGLPNYIWAADITWTGAGPNALYSNASNWSTNTTPNANPGDKMIFSGTGIQTRLGQPEVVLLDSTVNTNVGSNPGLRGVKLTASQTTSVTFQSDISFNARGPRFAIDTVITGTDYSILLEAGSGSLIWDGEAPNLIKMGVGPGAGTGSGSTAYFKFINNNASSGSVLKFGTGFVFAQGGTGIRVLIFEGTGDIIFNGSLFFNQGGYTLTKRGSGMLTLGGDSSNERLTELGLSYNPVAKYTHRTVLEAGALNINHAGALASTGTLTISATGAAVVTINNTSGTAVALKKNPTNPRIILNSDFTFVGSNDLTLGTEPVDLTGAARTITVSAARLGLGGALNSTTTAITVNGSGTLAMGGNSSIYSGTVTVPNGTFMANGGFGKSTIVIGVGAKLGGDGTVGKVTMGAGSALRAGDLTLVVSDATVMDAGVFTGSIGAGNSTLSIDKSASDAGALLQLPSGGEIEFALGKGRTHTAVNIINSNTATTPSLVFNNNIIKVKDLTAGTAEPGVYMLFKTSGTFDTDFQGLSYDASGNITGGLSVEALPAYTPPNFAYILKKTDNGIGFFLYGPPTITSDSTMIAVQGWAYQNSITFTDGIETNNSIGVVAGLPAGLSYNPVTGLITGMPTGEPRIYIVTLTATNAIKTTSTTVSIDVRSAMPAPVFTIEHIIVRPEAPFSYELTANNLPQSFTAGSDLPAWMTISQNSSTRLWTLEGIPPAGGGTYTFTLYAHNPSGSTLPFTMTVIIGDSVQAPVITSATSVLLAANYPFNYQIAPSGIAGFFGISGTLPSGVAFDALTGVFSGTPSAASTSTVTLYAINSSGTGSSPLTIEFVENRRTGAGQPFSYQITGGTPATTYAATGLPPGVSLDPSTGLISGTTSASGLYLVQITATDSTGGKIVSRIVISIDPTNATLVTYAGALDTPGLNDGTSVDARFNMPSSAAIALSGTIYVADYANNAIRAIALDDTVSSYVINATKPAAIAVDSLGNIYFADQENNTINKILASDKSVEIIVGGLLSPGGLAIDASDNVYFTDSGRNQIKKISATTGTISVVAGSGAAGSGNGVGNAARFKSPEGLVYDKATNKLYVADTLNSLLRAVDLASGSVTTVAGLAGKDGYWDGAGNTARFHTPEGLAIDAAGFVYVADTGNSTIRVCDPKTGFVSTLIGTPQQAGSADGSGTTALMKFPQGIVVDTNGTGDIYIIDSGNSAIRTLIATPCFAKLLVDTRISTGASITLDGSAWGAPTPMYKWYKNGVQITGTQGNTLLVDAATTPDAAATYQVVAYNSSGTISNSMQLAVGVPGGGQTTTASGEDLKESGGGASSLWYLLSLATLVSFRAAVRRWVKK